MRIFDRDLGNLSRRDFPKMVLGSGMAVTGLAASEILNPVARTTMHAIGGRT
jgi:hypothetical protein